jgi:hypothetical protein
MPRLPRLRAAALRASLTPGTKAPSRATSVSAPTFTQPSWLSRLDRAAADAEATADRLEAGSPLGGGTAGSLQD